MITLSGIAVLAGHQVGDDALGRLQVACFEQLRVVDYIFGPKLPHYPLHNLRTETGSIRIIVAEMTEALIPECGSPGYGVNAASVGL